jgi:hypothetical protein
MNNAIVSLGAVKNSSMTFFPSTYPWLDAEDAKTTRALSRSKVAAWTILLRENAIHLRSGRGDLGNWHN